MKKTLLLADDSPTIQKVINLTFADEGIDVIAVGDGNAAIQQLRETTPDLVMADVHMPGLNGYQICERIRQNAELSKVPVILLVGSFEPFDEEEAKRVGADDFLMKPFQSIRQLVSRVTALLAPQAEGTAVASETQDTEAVVSGISDVPAFSAGDIFHTPRPEPEETTHAAPVETEPLVETAAETPEIAEVIASDDLSDFDSEFDQKFPDAAALSSETLDSEIPATAYPTSFQIVEEPEAEEETPAWPSTVEEMTNIIAPDTAVETPEMISEEETPPPYIGGAFPVLELSDLDPSEGGSRDEGMLELERVKDARDEDHNTLIFKPAEPASEIVREVEAEPEPEPEPEPAFVPEPVSEPELYRAPELEPEPESVPEQFVTEETEPALVPGEYNFSEADAFDDDRSIEESFRGITAEEKPAVPFAEPLERVWDTTPEEVPEKTPVEVEAVEPEEALEGAEDISPMQEVGEQEVPVVDYQVPEALIEEAPVAEVFIPEAPVPEIPAYEPPAPPPQISADAIEAIAQRVLEKLTAKLVKDMAPEMRDIILNEISGEDAAKE